MLKNIIDFAPYLTGRALQTEKVLMDKLMGIDGN